MVELFDYPENAILKGSCSKVFPEWRINRLQADLERHGLYDGKFSGIFLPYVGKNYVHSDIKVMYVGKATLRWGELTGRQSVSQLSKGPSGTVRMAMNYYGGLSPNNYPALEKEGNAWKATGYASPFWQRIYQLTSSLQEDTSDLIEYHKSIRNKEKSEKCFTSIAWSNIFKIGNGEGNPPETMKNFLLENFDTLSDEIRLLEPDLIIFSSGLKYDKYLKKSLKIKRGLRDIRGLPQIANVPNCNGALAFRLPHFQDRNGLPEKRFKWFYKYLRPRLNRRIKRRNN